jgi:hypothetical protein
MQFEPSEDQCGDLIDLGAASEETRGVTVGVDEHLASYWLMPGLSLD